MVALAVEGDLLDVDIAVVDSVLFVTSRVVDGSVVLVVAMSVERVASPVIVEFVPSVVGSVVASSVVLFVSAVVLVVIVVGSVEVAGEVLGDVLTGPDVVAEGSSVNGSSGGLGSDHTGSPGDTCQLLRHVSR